MRRGGWTFLFLAPWLVGLVVLTGGPMVASLLLSWTSARGDQDWRELEWTGWANYAEAVSIQSDQAPPGRHAKRDEHFALSVWNSLVFAALAVPLEVLLALGSALLLNRSFRGVRAIRAWVFLPGVLGGVAAFQVWSSILSPQFGAVNAVLRGAYEVIGVALSPLVKLHPGQWPVPGWFRSPTWCKPALALAHAWSFGVSMMVFLAALRRIPRSTLEAATLDGAAGLRRFRTVVWPQIAPLAAFNAVVGTALAAQSFTGPFLLESRAQDNGLLLFGVHFYRAAFEPPHRFGYAAAMAWLFAIVLCVPLAAALLWPRWMHTATDEGPT